MKRVSIKMVVSTDIDVTANMVQALLVNQLHFLLRETVGGDVRWKDALLSVQELPR